MNNTDGLFTKLLSAAETPRGFWDGLLEDLSRLLNTRRPIEPGGEGDLLKRLDADRRRALAAAGHLVDPDTFGLPDVWRSPQYLGPQWLQVVCDLVRYNVAAFETRLQRLRVRPSQDPHQRPVVLLLDADYVDPNGACREFCAALEYTSDDLITIRLRKEP
jgi:predicted component of type VI protein secretion system